MSVATSIPDTSLGLTSSELQILRQQQQIALQGGHAGSVSRGRGTGRESNSSSRAASAASSHGRLLLDPMSLRALSHQLDQLQEQIRRRVEYVCPFTTFCVLVYFDFPCDGSDCIPLTQNSWRIKCKRPFRTLTIALVMSFVMPMRRLPVPDLFLRQSMTWKMNSLRSVTYEISSRLSERGLRGTIIDWIIPPAEDKYQYI